MAVNPGGLVVPGHGTFFTADANTALPAGGIAAFKNISTAGPTPWVNFGHTSSENPPALSVDGGDATALNTWLTDSAFIVYAAESWSLTGASLQVDQETLTMIYNGWATTDAKGTIIPSRKAASSRALVMVSSDDTGNLGIYMPNVSFGHGDAPSVSTDGYFELPFSAAFKAAAGTALPASADGVPGLFAIYGPEAFVTP